MDGRKEGKREGKTGGQKDKRTEGGTDVKVEIVMQISGQQIKVMSLKVTFTSLCLLHGYEY